MRLNAFIAQATGLSRRAADTLIIDGRVRVNGQTATLGQQVIASDKLTIDNSVITPAVKRTQTIMLNKPTGYVCSRVGQGSKTVYDLLPTALHSLKPVGRLDKDSSGLILLTNDGQLANKLTHPSYQKEKVYEVVLNRPLQSGDKQAIESGVSIDNEYISRLRLSAIENCNPPAGGENCLWRIAINQGRNRQIRRTFAAVGYTVTRLHRTHFGPYSIKDITLGSFRIC